MAQMTFDADALYIAVECKDPDMKAVSGSSDAVEFIISTTPENKAYYHIKIRANNTRWDTLAAAVYDVAEPDSTWTGEYKTAVQKGPDAWTVEIAIPWKTIDRGAPKNGTEIKANIVRRTRRRPDGNRELSSWSQRRTIRSPEAEHFGTLVFK